MLSDTNIEAKLMELGAASDAAFNAVQAGLMLAALDRPGVDLTPYTTHLARLADSMAARRTLPPAEALHVVMSELFGYRGDRQTYDDMKNADLLHVIERRRGLPVALGLLYLAAAKGAMLDLKGLAFPGHFLMRLEDGANRIIIDPFNDGRPASSVMLRAIIKRAMGATAELEPAYFEPVSDRAVLIRLLMNIRIRALRSGDPARAAEIARRMTLVAPRDPSLWADLAALHRAAGNLKAAREAFERSVEIAPSEKFRSAAEAALQSVRHKLN